MENQQPAGTPAPHQGGSGGDGEEASVVIPGGTPSDSPGKVGPGPFGDGATHPGKYNLRLAQQAIQSGWPITPAMRQLIVNQMVLVVGQGDSARDRIAAARVLAAIDGVNARREEAASGGADAGGAGQTVNVTLQVASVRQELLSDPDYLEFLRQRALNGDAGVVRHDGIAGPVEARPSSNGAGPSSNGHH